MKPIVKMFIFIKVLSVIKSIFFQPVDSHTVINYSDSFYNNHSKENFDHLNSNIIEKLRKKTRHKLFSNHKYMNSSHSNRLKINRRSKDDISTADAMTSLGETENEEIVVKEREIKIYISRDTDCNIKIQEKIFYEQHAYNSNFLEHLILNSNFDYINVENVLSNDVQLQFFAFNRKINLFSVFYENFKNLTQYLIDYQYTAVNLIKSHKTRNPTEKDFEDSYNYIVWKLFNENVGKIKQKFKMQFYFDLEKSFQNEDVRFIHNNTRLEFTKNIENISKDEQKAHNNPRQTVMYEYNGFLESGEVFVIDVKFPLYFENCHLVTINIPVIIAGSIFIIFLIFVLYIILSQFLWFEN